MKKIPVSLGVLPAMIQHSFFILAASFLTSESVSKFQCNNFFVLRFFLKKKSSTLMVIIIKHFICIALL